jgi:hypothetical protein
LEGCRRDFKTRISTDIKAERFKNGRRAVNKNMFTNGRRRAKTA